MFYLTVILLTFLAVAGGNFAAGSLSLSSLGFCLLHAFLAIAAVIAIDGISAFLIRRLPQKWFAPLSPLYRVGDREIKLLRRLGVSAWKDHVPELGGFTSFHKNRLASTGDPAYLERFLLESNYGVAIHFFNAILGFALLALPFWGRLSVSLPVAIVNFILSLLPIMILRFHTPTLRRLYRRALRKQEKKAV